MDDSYQKRVIDEFSDLASRTNRLLEFFSSPEFGNLSMREQNLLALQYDIMQVYAKILTQRLA